MKKTTIIPTVSVLIALVCATLFCLNWNSEPLLKGKEQPITQSDIEQNLITDFNGFPAGEDIPRLTGAEDFSEIIYLSDYVTAEPVGIVETGISSLKPWEDHYYTQRVKGRVTGRRIRRPEITSSVLGFAGQLSAILPVGASRPYLYRGQIPQETAKAIERGKSVTLPIGQKVSMTNAAQNELSTICEEYGADWTACSMLLMTNGRRSTSSSCFCHASGLPPCFGLCLP